MRSRIEMNENLSGRSVEVNGATLYYKEHGDGAPLILIHGGLSTTLNGSRWSPRATPGPPAPIVLLHPPYSSVR